MRKAHRVGRVCRGSGDGLTMRLCEGETASLLCVRDERDRVGRPVSACNAHHPAIEETRAGGEGPKWKAAGSEREDA